MLILTLLELQSGDTDNSLVCLLCVFVTKGDKKMRV